MHSIKDPRFDSDIHDRLTLFVAIVFFALRLPLALSTITAIGGGCAGRRVAVPSVGKQQQQAAVMLVRA